MPLMNKPDDPISLGVLDGLSAVLGQLAEELAFVEENSDRGLRGIKTLLFASAGMEELRKRYESQGWQAQIPNPIATPPRA